jgi:peroxiredoxin
MTAAKKILLYATLIFGGLFAYQHFTAPKIRVYNTKVAGDFASFAYHLNEGKLKSVLIRDSPHYLIYFASSDCSECQNTITHLVSDYDLEVKNSDQLEFIMYSFDTSFEQAQEWMRKDNISWPVVFDRELKAKKAIFSFKESVKNQTPLYLLLNHEGKVLGSDSKPRDLISQVIK